MPHAARPLLWCCMRLRAAGAQCMAAWLVLNCVLQQLLTILRGLRPAGCSCISHRLPSHHGVRCTGLQA